MGESDYCFMGEGKGESGMDFKQRKPEKTQEMYIKFLYTAVEL